jgi:hypothetical protein
VWFNTLVPLKSALRATIYQAEKNFQRIRFASLSAPQAGWPILLGVSFPKSGTHLLDQILLGFSKVAPFSRRLHSFYAEYEGESGRKRAPEQALAWLDSLRPRDIASAHLFARPDVLARVNTPAFIPYFIFRDPRDVVVSHVFYVTDMEARHVHHDYYASLPDFDSRLRISILGRPDLAARPEPSRRVEFPDIAERFAPYLGWLEQPSVMKIHFEDLINGRAATLNRILDHFLAHVPLHLLSPKGAPRQLILDALESSINPGKSPTFRSGRTGEWEKHFTEEHKRMFKDVAGDLLIKLGYESNKDW